MLWSLKWWRVDFLWLKIPKKLKKVRKKCKKTLDNGQKWLYNNTNDTSTLGEWSKKQGGKRQCSKAWSNIN